MRTYVAITSVLKSTGWGWEYQPERTIYYDYVNKLDFNINGETC